MSRNGLKLDELGLEIAQIALPASLALTADPIASLVDTAFIGQIGILFLCSYFNFHLFCLIILPYFPNLLDYSPKPVQFQVNGSIHKSSMIMIMVHICGQCTYHFRVHAPNLPWLIIFLNV